MPRFTVVMDVVAYEEGIEERVPFRMSFHVVAPTRYDAVNHLAQSIRKVADEDVFEPRVPSASVAEDNPVASLKAVADAMVAGLNEKENEILRKRFETVPMSMSMGWMFTKPKDDFVPPDAGREVDPVASVKACPHHPDTCPECIWSDPHGVPQMPCGFARPPKLHDPEFVPPDAGRDDEEEDK